MSLTEDIDAFIEVEGKGNARDAVNVALAKLEAEVERLNRVLDVYAEEHNWRYYEDHAYKWCGDLGTDQPWLLARTAKID